MNVTQAGPSAERAHYSPLQAWPASPRGCGKLSYGPNFTAKLRDIVGLYVDPQSHAVVLSGTRRARSRRSTAPSQLCRSSAAVAAP